MKAPSLKFFLPFGIALALAALSPAIWAKMAPAGFRTVAVMAGRDASLDACRSEGRVKGLDSAGDGYLAVRAGPGPQFSELDELGNGQPVYICDQKGKWLGIVYTRMPATDCGVSNVWRKPAPYRGPCSTGWVYGDWIAETAG
jgi:hypothetical protein